MFKIPAPNYTQTPNALFDEWLSKLKLVELRVLMVIMRKTFGWHKIRDRISLSQLEKLTGSGRKEIIAATRNLEKMGLITKEVIGEKGDQDTYYELVIHEDSNNSYQWESPTPPSGNFPPTKETLPKEDISPIVPKGDIPPRKSKREEKLERASEVFTTDTQHKDLEKRCQAQGITVQACYDKLSTWKIGKEISGGKSDYMAILNWVIAAVTKGGSEKEKGEKERELSQKVVEKFPILVGRNEIQMQNKGLLFCYGHHAEFIEFTEYGFRDRVFSRLKKMNQSVEGL